jgi:catechol 2,3-dioxygenase-like lactoylglutathione lyase family enzyme
MAEINFFLLHVDLVVDDIEREIAFYKDVLGFEVFEDCVLNNEASLFLSNGRAGCMRLVFLGRNKRTTMIELVQFLNDSGQPIQASQLKFKWNLSFFVDDLDQAQQHLLEKGFKPLTSQYEITLSSLGRSKVIFYQDPEGFLLEIMAPIY